MSKKRILLVDDSTTTLFMEEMILKASYELERASDGEEAIEKALAAPPDLVLLDLVMPGMDGFEVCRRLREEPTTRDVPVIMVTTRGEEHNVEKGFAAGCTDYVTKPINTLEIKAKVRTYLGEGSGV